MIELSDELWKGRGAQILTANKFLNRNYVTMHPEGLDEPFVSEMKTRIFVDNPKSIVNKVKSPDVGMLYSLNPYQGCEHGCIYCYARNTHPYWGFSAGTDFESKIVAKPEAPALLEKHLLNPKWKPVPIALSGNTDCYQPAERKLKITRGLLKVFLKYRHPVGIITKSSLILRDLDILHELASLRLVRVMISITSLDDDLRLKLEPRTTTYKQRLNTITALSEGGINTGVMVAPIIPGLNDHEIPEIIRASAESGAKTAGYTMVRLNGDIETIFEDWVNKAFPDKAEKVMNGIRASHGGAVSDSRFGRRMKGEGNMAEMIRQLFVASRKKYLPLKDEFVYNLNAFERPGDQLSLF